MNGSAKLIVALVITGAIAAWGIITPDALTAFAKKLVAIQFTSRAWFIMLTVSFMLLVCAWLALGPYAHVKLGQDTDEPEFPTISWLTMLFAAGMGVGLLYYGTAEPLTHYQVIYGQGETKLAADHALFITNFHWGLHAWAIYALTGLVIAYFGFRLGQPTLVGTPVTYVFGTNRLTSSIAWVCDLFAIVAIAIGLGGLGRHGCVSGEGRCGCTVRV